MGRPVILTRPRLVLLLLWPLLPAAAAVVLIDRRDEARLQRALAERAPIAVVDHFAFVRGSAGGDGVAAGLAQVQRIGERLRDEGYVVLDRRYVDAVPERLVVRP